MKLTIVTKNMGSGGSERVIAQLVNYASQKQIAVDLILIDDRPIFYTLSPAVNVHIIGKKSGNPLLDKVLRYREVCQLIKDISPNAVLSMPEEIGIYVIGALLGTKIPVFVSERNDPRTMPYKKATRVLRKLLYPFADGYIFQTKQAASFFSRRIQAKGVVLPNPLDLSRIPEPYSEERSKVIVAAGRLNKQKNFPLLIDAFSEFYKTHSDYRLIVYGEGNLRESLTQYAQSKLPESVFSFPGEERALLERMRDASLFVLSSDYEGMPNVLIEAMACGLPCVSTRCPSGGPEELIEPNVNGLLAPVNDAKALSQAISFMIDHPEEAASMGQKATSVRERLNAEVVCQRWLTYLLKTEI